MAASGFCCWQERRALHIVVWTDTAVFPPVFLPEWLEKGSDDPFVSQT
jgi:hypothetical protein